MFLLFLFFSLISLLIAGLNPNVHRVINKLNVGSINIYKLIPSSLIVLVNTIFINIPNSFVINPPIINIRVDFISSP